MSEIAFAGGEPLIRSLVGIAEIANHKIAVPPVFLDLHPRFEKDLRSEKRLHVFAGVFPDLFERFALFADNIILL